MGESDVYLKLGNKIKTRRIFLGLSAEDLGRRAGLSRVSIVNIETGKHNVLLHNYIKIFDVLLLKFWKELKELA